MKGFSAAQLLLAVFALIVGLVAGGLGPRTELRRAKLKIAELEERPCKGRTGADIAKIFQGRPWEDERVKLPSPSPMPEPEVQADTDVPEPAQPEPGFQIRFGDEGENVEPQNTEEAMSMAREALELRNRQARAALEEDARPTAEQQQAIDELLGRMNDDLIGLARDLQVQVESGEEPSRRDAMLYAAETLDVFLSAEDELRGLLDADQIANLQEESLDPMSYVDPGLIDVLQDLNLE